MVTVLSQSEASQNASLWRAKLLKTIRQYGHNSSFVQFNHQSSQHTLWLYILWEKVMAGKKEAPKKAEFKAFANLEIPTEMKEDVKAWLARSEDIHEAIEVMVLDGNKITVTQNEGNGSFQATAFCHYAKSPNAGYILSAFASNWYDAIAVLAWKHCILANRQAWMKDEPPAPLDTFG